MLKQLSCTKNTGIKTIRFILQYKSIDHFMFMLLQTICIFYWVLPVHSVMHCASKIGTYIIPIYVHMDPRSLVKIRTSLIKQYNRDLNTMASTLKFIGAVFDLINEELEPFGVQVESDQTKLVHKKKCISLPSSIVVMPMKDVNLYVLDCEKDRVDYHTEINSCNINVGVSFGDLRVMTNTIKEEIIKALAGNEYKVRNEFTSSFNANLCDYAMRCGDMNNGLQSVRNIGSESYITGSGFVKRLHDLYDDVEKEQNGDPDVYATEDYSNEEELHADMNEEQE